MSKFQLHSGFMVNRLKELQKKENKALHKVYPHQLDAVLRTRLMFLNDLEKRKSEGKRDDEEAFRPMAIVSPTGSGKSGMIVMLPYVLEADRVLILTPSIVISEQIVNSFNKGLNRQSFLEMTGVITERQVRKVLEQVVHIKTHSDMDNVIMANAWIVNAQKFGGRSGTTLSLLYRNEKIIKDVEKFFSLFDLLIVDEAHHYPAATWKNIVDTFSKPARGLRKKIVFLTATPFRKGPSGDPVPILDDLRDRIAFKISTKELVQGDYIREADFDERPDPSTLPEDIKAHFESENSRSLPFQAQAMILVSTIKEAKECEKLLNSKLKEDGMDKYAVAIFRSNGKVKVNSEKLIKDFTAGLHRVAIVCGLHKEGYDNSKVTLCVILRNVQSKLLFTQFVGRCMRVRAQSNSAGISVVTGGQKAVILSYEKYKQRKMWDEKEKLAEHDPVELSEIRVFGEALVKTELEDVDLCTTNERGIG